MSDKVTSESLRLYFQKSSESKNKIFVESATDEKNGNNIAAYFNNNKLSIDFCKDCINFYIENSKGVGVSLADFVLQLSYIREVVESLAKDRASVKEIMKRTQERMEGLR
jgi:hypothetical protein